MTTDEERRTLLELISRGFKDDIVRVIEDADCWVYDETTGAPIALSEKGKKELDIIFEKAFKRKRFEREFIPEAS